MWRLALLLFPILTAACVDGADGAYFLNPKTGEAVRACGPLIGWTIAIRLAQRTCFDNYAAAGWTHMAAPPEQAAALR